MAQSPLEIERAGASFPVREMTYLLRGGKSATERHEMLEAAVEREPVFANSDLYCLDRPGRHRRAMQKQRRVIELARELQVPRASVRAAVHDQLGTDLQDLMFLPNIRSTFSEEQQAYWLPRAEAWEVVGCYAQTELGHGSNVRALETTATYLPETDEIEINSPTTTSTKWWPGALGRTANHAIVYARLILAGRDMGIHNFMVQIRDMDTHRPLSGITAGDIGPKIGYNNQDNGFCRFDRVRIPRTNMAMKYATLSPGGEYTTLPARKVASYSSMTHVRVTIVVNSGLALSQACTIAVRYSAVRRQGFTSKGDGSEECVLDYAMQQQRLLPLVATSYAFHVSGVAMQRMAAGDDVETLHIASSGLKALCSRITSDGIEACRKACGGHGYLAVSGIPELLGNYIQNVTVEGENFVIAQQTTRGLLKQLARARAAVQQGAYDRPTPVAVAGRDGDADYIYDLEGAVSARCTAQSAKDFLSSELHCEAYKQRAAWQLREVERELAEAEASGLPREDAWNALCPDIIRASEAHCFHVLVRHFCDAVREFSGSARVSPALTRVLENCSCLFNLYWMQEGIGDFLQSGYLDVQQATMLRSTARGMLAVLRPDAVALVDAWGHSDHSLNSALGRYDGQVYEALYASAQGDVNPMNSEPVTQAFEESLKPMRSRL